MFRFWFWWLKIPWNDMSCSLPLRWKLMAKRRIKCPVSKIVGCIGISDSIWFSGWGRILPGGNMQSLSMDYERLRIFINDIPRSLHHWKMLSEDLEHKGGILARCQEVRRYLGIIEGGCRGWRRNCVTERRTCWEMGRKRQDGGRII